MRIFMPKTSKNEQNCPYISVRDNRKIDFTKKSKAFLFSIFSSEIFRKGVELPKDLIYLAGLLN